MNEIRYIDRLSKQVKLEKVYGQKALWLLYGNGWLSKLLFFLFSPAIVKTPLFSRFYGFLQKRRASRRKVKKFIDKYEVDSSEFLKKTFTSFNDFFIRKLHKKARPIEPSSEILTMPADGRYLVFDRLDEVDGFFVKNQRFSLDELVQSPTLAKIYKQGSMAIIRLCPVDYHRFHFPIDCIPDKASLINGYLYSVNLSVLKKNVQYLTQNKRYITSLKTKDTGTILFIEVGATNVGTVHQTYSPGTLHRKGEEKGYFSFGGSCIIMLFEPGVIAFDTDLLQASKNKMEVRGLMGQSLARKTANRAL